MARYYVETYGCTSNRGETQEIEQRLQSAGHRPTELQAADVAILNTCTVIETTERKMLRRAKKLATATEDLIVTGCMALAQGEAFAEVDCQVVHWDNVPGAVANGECPTATADAEPALNGVIGILPIARGCTSNCSYCITKQATGRIDSRSIDENVERARALVHAGAKELRLTGQDTGVYGWDMTQGRCLLPELLERICTEIEGEYRIRLGMANPGGVEPVRDKLADVFANHDRIYNFLHVPVQSGSTSVLRDMRRQHGVEEYEAIVETFDEHLDRWTLATDFMVGFPTETPEDHQDSMDLLERTRPEKINVTRFSKRPGTDAAEMKGLGGSIKKDRSKEMSARKREISQDVYESMIGSQREVMVVEPGRDDSVKCRDQAYRQIIIQNTSEYGIELGTILTVEVTDSRPMYAFGKPVATHQRRVPAGGD